MEKENGHDKKSEKEENPMGLFLYSQEIEGRPWISTIINFPRNHSDRIQAPADPNARPTGSGGSLGTFNGVFMPCIHSILGVILFIRLPWIVGTAGVIKTCLIQLVCTFLTLLTALSMSAIVTNGLVFVGGGAYLMISRYLSPEIGGSVGLFFYVALCFANSMYNNGTLEILLTYIAPDLIFYGDLHNSIRFYGTLLLLIQANIVYGGIKYAKKLSYITSTCVMVSMISVLIGIFTNYNGNDKLMICVLGKRLLKDIHPENCTKEIGGPLYNIYCSNSTCDPYFTNHNVTVRKGIPGPHSEVFYDNLEDHFGNEGEIIATNRDPEDITVDNGNAYNQVLVTSTTTLVIMLGIFFPSVTGIMAGSNMSGDLADAQRSIPRGTISAIISTSLISLSFILLIPAIADNLLLRDKYGESIGRRLVVASIAWPHECLVLIGTIAATLGGGLRSMVGAPKLLQAIATDGTIPFLALFADPKKAFFMTIGICLLGILIGNIDVLAPVITNFYLICYACMNLACLLQILLKAPNWRPRFKYYHWSASLIGLVLCITIMFLSNYYYAMISIGMTGLMYKYIEYKGADKEWGCGLQSLTFTAAKHSLLRLEEGPPHTKNWRPQILILCKLTDQYIPKYHQIISLASQLKAGKGLSICAAVIPGGFCESAVKVMAAKENLRKMMDEDKVQGFVDVLTSKDIAEGIGHLVQSCGLGGMKPNTVILGWPSECKKSDQPWNTFLTTVRNVVAARMALLVPKGIDSFPNCAMKISGNIDIWWILHDGGLLIILPFLLKQHQVWKHCQLRVFTVGEMEDNSTKIKEKLKQYIYDLRIEAEVEVVYMPKKWKEENEEEAKSEEVINKTEDQSGTLGAESVSKMDAAVKMNEVIVNKSRDSKLVILNLPEPPSDDSFESESNYMGYLGALTGGLERVLLVRGGGQQVTTIYL